MKQLFLFFLPLIFLIGTFQNVYAQDTSILFQYIIPIESGNDDVEELEDGEIYVNSTDIELVEDGDPQIIGLHFKNLPIDSLSEITQAYIQFQTDEVSVGNCDIDIFGEATDNASSFSNTFFDVSNRTKTDTSINWIPPNWQIANQASMDQQTPDLTPILQELVNQPDWSSGNAVNFIFEGSGRRVAEAFEGVPEAAAKLVIQMEVPVLQNNLSGIFINELMAKNSVVADEFGETDDWLELYNANDVGVLLEGLYLSDDPTDLMKWQITEPLYISPHSFALFWLDDAPGQGGNHIPFKLASGGETVTISQMQNGNLVTLDQITFPSLDENVSYGRETDGSSTWVNFGEYTPNASNNGSSLHLDATVEFSIASGFYSAGTQLHLTTSDSTAEIRFTMDGSPPTASSTLYNNPFTLTSTTQIRAGAFKSGFASSTSRDEFYLINGSHELPVVQVQIDPKYLFDDEEGMYITGSNGITGFCSDEITRNWNQDWRRPVSIRYFEPDGDVGFRQDAEMKIAGGCSRGFAVKPFNIFLDDKIEYPLFQQLDYNEYKRFKLRGSGNDFPLTMIRDGAIQSMLYDQADIDLMAYEPVVVYLNNQYWGFYGMREFFNQHYLETHHGIDRDSIDLIKNPYTWFEVKEGDKDDWDDLTNFIQNNSMQNLDNYNQLAERIDLNEFMNYHAVEIYLANYDWPGNNSTVWRDKREGGKWRWMLYDLDISTNFGQWSPAEADYNMIQHSTTPFGAWWPNPSSATLFFRKIVENQYFEYEFVQRTCTFGQVTFAPDRAEHFIDSLAARVESEVPAFLNKFNNVPSGWLMWLDKPVGGNYNAWQNNLDNFKDFFSQRIGFVLFHFKEHFDYDGHFNLTINYDESSNGNVVFHLNEMKIPYNYSGTYFQNIPIRIKAIPNEGYYFSHWLETGDTNPILNYQSTTDAELTPIFLLNGTTSIQGIQPVTVFDVYPNPVNTLLSVSCKSVGQQDIMIQISDVIGQVIFEKEIRVNNVMQLHNVDVHDWAKGIYFLKTQIQGKEIVRKIIVE